MKGKQLLEISLGIVTSVGGFLEAGSIATAAQAGAGFGFALIWPIVLGTLCIIFLIEMCGRLAAVSHHPLPAAVRERFGIHFYAIVLLAETLIDYLVLASEIGGACMGLKLLTGIGIQWFALPVALLAWLLLWNGTFGMIEYGVSLLGLSTLVFIVAAFELAPPPADLVAGLVPALPEHDRARYWFLAVSIIGATISPYLLNFYSSGAVEDKWEEDHIPVNRAIAAIGMSFGGAISLAVLIAAACTLGAHGIQFERLEQLPALVTGVLGAWGYYILAGGVFIACFGAALELTLDIAYVYAQAFGWNWGENQKPNDASRFSTLYTVFIFAACLPIALGVDPLKLTMFSMAATSLVLPLTVLPLLVLMNDQRLVGAHRNGWISNTVVFLVIILAFVLAVVAIPLVIFGGG